MLFNLIPYLIGLGPAGAAAITGEYGNISDIFERSNGLTRRVYSIVEYWRATAEEPDCYIEYDRDPRDLKLLQNDHFIHIWLYI